MLFVVTAYDYTDPDAFNRRMALRPAHMANGEKMMRDGKFIFGGAILNDNNKMVGGVLVVDFNSREEVDAWLEVEPYVTEKVWEKIEVNRFLVPPQFLSFFPNYSMQAA